MILGVLQRVEDEARELQPPQPQARVVAMQAPLARLNVRNLPGDLFGDGSMFAKTLVRILTLDQRSRAREIERLATYKTRVHWVVLPLDKQLGLSREQHRRFVELIAKQTHPLERYGELDDDAVMLQASRLPEADLKPIFDDAQWHLLKGHFDQAKRIEKSLIEKGYLRQDESNGTQPKAG
jgi:hypothetical protein